MSARPGFTITKRVSVDGGESPNAYVPQVTVEIRVHYPARQVHRAADVLGDAIAEARRELMQRQQQYDELMSSTDDA